MYVDDPVNASMSFERFGVRGQVQSYVRPLGAAYNSPRVCMEMRGSGPIRPGELEGSRQYPGFPDPVSSTIFSYPSSDLLTFPDNPSYALHRDLRGLHINLPSWRGRWEKEESVTDDERLT